MKQETLEEAAERIFPHKPFVKVDITNKKREAFIEGYKLAQQRMYSEEEVLELLHKSMIYTFEDDYQRTTTTKWFEQFKKKGGDK